MAQRRTETEADADQDTDDGRRRRTDAPTDPETGHLDDMEDGCGCAEVWEHMSERRAED